MNVFVVYAHPGEDSFTRDVRDEFLRGLSQSGHSFELSDLYRMDFRTDMNPAEYFRESNYRADLPVPEDVLAEQAKINRADAAVFIYPVFWTEAPAKLVGWFDRVWTYGFAYGERSMKVLDKALFICITGHPIEHLREYGHLQAMETVMLGDRIFDRAKSKRMIVLDAMTKFDMTRRESNRLRHLKTVFEAAGSL